MGCFLKGIGSVFLILGSLLFWVTFAGMSVLTSEGREAVACIREAPVKRLADVAREDGPAWVKVNILAVTASEPLFCGRDRCVYLERKFFEHRVNDIKRAGSWTQEVRPTLIRDDRHSIPVVLADETGRIQIQDWLGIEVWPDLLRVRRLDAGSADESAVIDDLQHQPQGEQLKRAADSGALRIEESYLPDRVDAWVLGSFRGGTPQVYANGKFYVTGLGPENFANAMAERAGLLNKIRWLCGFMSIVFPLTGAYFLLKRRD